MEQRTLPVEKRHRKGKSYARQARRLGYLPGVVYGKTAGNILVQVPLSTFLPLWREHQRGHHVLFTLSIQEGGKVVAQVPALLQEVQRDPLTDQLLTVDFHAVSLTETITTSVPLRFVGEAPGVREGGVLEHSLWEVEVECLPTQIPDGIEVDLSSLGLDEVIHVRDLQPPQGVTILTDPDTVVAAVISPAALAAAEERAAATPVPAPEEAPPREEAEE